MAATTSKSKKNASIVPKKPKVSSKKKPGVPAKKPFVDKPYMEVGGIKARILTLTEYMLRNPVLLFPRNYFLRKFLLVLLRRYLQEVN